MLQQNDSDSCLVAHRGKRAVLFGSLRDKGIITACCPLREKPPHHTPRNRHSSPATKQVSDSVIRKAWQDKLYPCEDPPAIFCLHFHTAIAHHSLTFGSSGRTHI